MLLSHKTIYTYTVYLEKGTLYYVTEHNVYNFFLRGSFLLSGSTTVYVTLILNKNSNLGYSYNLYVICSDIGNARMLKIKYNTFYTFNTIQPKFV